MKFLADGMLGKLTRWLRILGCDVEYQNDLNDTKMISLASSQKRVLLTRDRDLFRRACSKNINAFLLKGHTNIDLLTEITKKFSINLKINTKTSRCPKCNANILPISKQAVKKMIPNASFQSYNDFWICQGCGNIYWHGSHWDKITRKLEYIRHICERACKSS